MDILQKTASQAKARFVQKEKQKLEMALFFLCACHIFPVKCPAWLTKGTPTAFTPKVQLAFFLTNASFSANGHRTVLLHMFSRMNTVRSQVCF